MYKIMRKQPWVGTGLMFVDLRFLFGRMWLSMYRFFSDGENVDICDPYDTLECFDNQKPFIIRFMCHGIFACLF